MMTLPRRLENRPASTGCDPQRLGSMLRQICAVDPYARPDRTWGCALSGHPTSAAAARAFTRQALGRWVPAETLGDVQWAVDELVANAVQHGLAAASDGDGYPIILGLARYSSAVSCLVADPGAELPVVRHPQDMAESGRGLHIVAGLATDWGWIQLADQGKAVWARFTYREQQVIKAVECGASDRAAPSESIVDPSNIASGPQSGPCPPQ